MTYKIENFLKIKKRWALKYLSVQPILDSRYRIERQNHKLYSDSFTDWLNAWVFYMEHPSKLSCFADLPGEYSENVACIVYILVNNSDMICLKYDEDKQFPTIVCRLTNTDYGTLVEIVPDLYIENLLLTLRSETEDVSQQFNSLAYPAEIEINFPFEKIANSNFIILLSVL